MPLPWNQASSKGLLPLFVTFLLNASHRYWDELGFNIHCPIHFTEDELRSHLDDAEGWNEVQDFWDSVAGIVDRDGWTPCDKYEDAVALFSELRQTGLKVMIGQDRNRFEKQTRWVEEVARTVDGHKSKRDV